MNGLSVVLLGPYPADPTRIKGGVQASVFGLATALRQRPDIEALTIFAAPQDAASQTDSAPDVVRAGTDIVFLRTPGKFLFTNVAHVPRIVRLVRRRSGTITHVHGTGMLQAALIARLQLAGLPCVWTLHGLTEKETLDRYHQSPSVPAYLRHLLYKAMERGSLRLARRVIVDTPYVRDALPGTGPRDGADAKILVIPQGIFTAEFAVPTSAAAPQTVPTLLSLGVIDPRKGHHLTLAAFAKLRAKIPASLVIAGSLTDPAYLERLRADVAALGLADCVMLAADLPRDAILRHLTAASVLTLHSREESQGIALCEALAAGVPIVASRVGGIPHVVTENADGLLFAYGDVAAQAEAIARLLMEPGLHEAMAASARRNGARFGWGAITDRIVGVYHQAQS